MQRAPAWGLPTHRFILWFRVPLNMRSRQPNSSGGTAGKTDIRHVSTPQVAFLALSRPPT